jgi:hypothetical protein
MGRKTRRLYLSRMEPPQTEIGKDILIRARSVLGPYGGSKTRMRDSIHVVLRYC